MLKLKNIIFAMLASLLAVPAFADVRELDRSELRANVRAGKSMSLSKLLSVIASKTEGEVVDVRGFDNGEVYYRVLIKTPEGRVAAAIVRADSGRFISGKTNVAKEIMATAKSKQPNSRNRNNTPGTRNSSSNNDSDGDSNDNLNSGGNGNGNSGGNGNGNSGGNGNGNSGGNGNGNSGGNGNGNSGGNDDDDDDD